MIRPSRSQDVPAIERILCECGSFSPAEISVARELLATLGTGSSDYVFVTAEEDGIVVGYACYGPAPLARGVFDLYWIAVAPEFQRRGLGRALLSEVELAVRRSEGRMLLVETAGKEGYEPTRRFYRSSGYLEVARIHDYYEVADDKVIFGKRFERAS